MAITAVTKVSETGSVSWANRTYEQKWRVQGDDQAETIPTILAATFGGTTIPLLGAAHANDAYAKVSEKSITEMEDETTWIVTVKYARPSYEDSPTGQLVESPLDEDPRIDWGETTILRVFNRDKDWTTIANSAKHPYDPPLELDVHYPAVTITRNEATYDPGQADYYRDSINSVACTIAGFHAGAYQAKLTQWSGRSATRNSISFWETTYRIEFRTDSGGWWEPVLDVGLYTSDGKRCLDADGISAVVPMNLNLYGAQLAAGVEALAKTWRVRRELSFAVLGLNI